MFTFFITCFILIEFEDHKSKCANCVFQIVLCLNTMYLYVLLKKYFYEVGTYHTNCALITYVLLSKSQCCLLCFTPHWNWFFLSCCRPSPFVPIHYLNSNIFFSSHYATLCLTNSLNLLLSTFIINYFCDYFLPCFKMNSLILLMHYGFISSLILRSACLLSLVFNRCYLCCEPYQIMIHLRIIIKNSIHCSVHDTSLFYLINRNINSASSNKVIDIKHINGSA